MTGEELAERRDVGSVESRATLLESAASLEEPRLIRIFDRRRLSRLCALTLPVAAENLVPRVEEIPVDQLILRLAVRRVVPRLQLLVELR